jgi:hypothetical protein
MNLLGAGTRDTIKISGSGVSTAGSGLIQTIFFKEPQLHAES